MVTVAGGGFVASGPLGKDRQPIPWAPPGTPPDRARGRRRGADAADRPGRAQSSRSATGCGSGTRSPGELFEHTHLVHLLAGRRRSSRPCAPTGGSDRPGERPGEVGATEAAVLEHAQSRPPTLGDRTAGLHRRPGRVREDDPGRTRSRSARRGSTWTTSTRAGRGLGSTRRRLDGLLAPLAAGVPGFYRRYDWEAGEFAELHVVEPVRCWSSRGSAPGRPARGDLRHPGVGQAPYDVRMTRGLARDGDASRRTGSSGWRTRGAVRRGRHPRGGGLSGGCVGLAGLRCSVAAGVPVVPDHAARAASSSPASVGGRTSAAPAAEAPAATGRRSPGPGRVPRRLEPGGARGRC